MGSRSYGGSGASVLGEKRGPQLAPLSSCPVSHWAFACDFWLLGRAEAALCPGDWAVLGVPLCMDTNVSCVVRQFFYHFLCLCAHVHICYPESFVLGVITNM